MFEWSIICQLLFIFLRLVGFWWDFFWVYGRNVSFGNLNLSSSRGIGRVFHTSDGNKKSAKQVNIINKGGCCKGPQFV